jgi:glycerol-3-phosphate responsive antiterminator
MTNNKNLGKRVKNQNHTCTIHRNVVNCSSAMVVSIRYSTIKKTSSAMVVSIRYSTIKKKEAARIEYPAIRVTSFVSNLDDA